ncbi:hypothetical protein [Pseudomonas corrugata]|uniref:hypothetical protein n=1 Tax=Pseudomonas corrugata TaxID=47879 RepID=UPI002234D3DF|nr:hypothetical protein [Pseudomonas corrugata]UZE09090.1 hypothetical protein LOY65_11435 [Pseudomonas corrugata]
MQFQRPHGLRLVTGITPSTDAASGGVGRGLRRGLAHVKEAYVLFPLLAVLLLLAIWMTTFYLINSELARARDNATTVSQEISATYEAQMLRKKGDRFIFLILCYSESFHGWRIQICPEWDVLCYRITRTMSYSAAITARWYLRWLRIISAISRICGS